MGAGSTLKNHMGDIMFDNFEKNKKLSVAEAETLLNQLEDQVGNIPEREQMVRMVTTFENPQMALHVVNYIITFLNSDTLKGYINHQEFCYLFNEATLGLYKLMFLDLLDADAPERNWEQYRARLSASYTSAKHLIYYLMSRIYEGREYDLRKLEIEVKQDKHIHMGGAQ